MAKKLSNPVAALISVPFQNNFDFGGGPNGDGFRYTLNFQPVIPVTLSDDWNLISRTIVPVIHQNDMIGTSSQTGLGDIVQSAFFSPKEPTSGGWIWGAGPALLIPTASDSLLGTEKFALGPTAVFLKQQNGWTYGALANHLWSVAGNDNRADVSATFLQPFVSYTTPKQTTFTLNLESTYDWNNSRWTIPVNAMASQLVKIGKSPVQFSLGARYYAEGPTGTPDWGLRFAVTLLFPK
ncbi:transporter [bacterium]|nr:transporter [bacterium]